MKTKFMLVALLGLFAMLFVGSAFAEDVVRYTNTTAASMQAIQLGLHIDEAVKIETAAIARLQNKSIDTTNLSKLLTSLKDLRATIQENNTNLSVVQTTRKEATQLVTSFRQQAQKLLSQDERDDISKKAKEEFKLQKKASLDAIKELRTGLNVNRLNAFARGYQKIALGLDDLEDVTLTPALEAKIVEIRALIEADKINAQQIAQIRTQIKTYVESIKANKTQIVEEVRVSMIKQRISALEKYTKEAELANISTTKLVAAHEKLSNLLAQYANGNISDFSKTALDLMKESGEVMKEDIYKSLNGTKGLLGARVQLKSEKKTDIKNWVDQKKVALKDIKEKRGMIKDVRSDRKDNRTEIRGDVRDLVRDVKDNVRQNRSGSSSDSDDNDTNESEDESDDSN